MFVYDLIISWAPKSEYVNMNMKMPVMWIMSYYMLIGVCLFIICLLAGHLRVNMSRSSIKVALVGLSGTQITDDKKYIDLEM